MNREIKFRAWNKEDKEWLIFFDIGNDGSYLDYTGYHPEMPENIKITQYSGIKDEEGTEIYSGDIVEIKDEVSKHETNTWRTVVTDDLTMQLKGDYDLDYMILKHFVSDMDAKGVDIKIKVIGNIYENQEMEFGQ